MSLLKIINLHKRFGDLYVLRGVNMEVEKGEVVVVIGPSGGGKSTLLKCINMLEPPTEGKIILDGIDLTAKGVDLNKIRQRIGIVFQQFNLFSHLTALENITLPLRIVKKIPKDEAEKIAIKYLK